MARLIPNERTWIGFATAVANIAAPTAAEITAATNLTGFCVSLNAASQGNTVPTPSFDTLFETSVPGTVQAQFQADFYRDDENDDAWDTLPRGTDGFFIIARFGGTGADNKPIATDVVEVWPVKVTARTMQNLTSNQVQMFSVQCSVPVEPSEDSVVAA
ncbi:MAG: hypothetical protein E6Q97_04100 [Desulfurellales bacterium]|nr:MAG: hypothetical protein E6Q97_04100 [Desulfurellales bacterium]